MAEREALQKRYAYQEMSNKVEQADRSLLHPRSQTEHDGAESLWGKANIGRMGDRAGTSEIEKKKSDKDKKSSKNSSTSSSDKKRKRGKEEEDVVQKKTILGESGGQTILDLGKLSGYQPTHASSRSAYESLLNTVGSRNFLGSQSPSILRDATEEILSILKNDNLRDPERQSQISYLLFGKKGGFTNDMYSRFVALGKQMNDYHAQDDDEKANTEKVDEEMGVAVIFDSDDENEGEDEDGDGNEVVEVVVSSSDEDDSSDEEDEDDASMVGDDNDDKDEMVLASDKKKVQMKKSGGTTLSVHEIDAHWLQRQLTKHSQDSDEGKNDVMDADTAANMANEILDILENTEDGRECENKLLVLLGFDLFPFIKILLKNRVRLWACIQIKRCAGDPPKLKKLEQALREEKTGQGKIVWEELNFQGKATDWQRERMEGMKERSRLEANAIAKAEKMKENASNDHADDMDVDDVKEEAVELDLDSLAFKDRSHIPQNKTCELPEKTWRATKKGYEEVYVPATRAVIPKDEKLIMIKELPEWTHPAFAGMEKLNRIQSKMYDVALKSTENILLCAPTGAGMSPLTTSTFTISLLYHYLTSIFSPHVAFFL